MFLLTARSWKSFSAIVLILRDQLHHLPPTPPPTTPTTWSPAPTPSGLRAVLLSTVGTASCSHMFSTKLAPTVAKRRHPRPHQNATLKYAAPGSIKAFQMTDEFLVKADSVTLTPLCRDEVGRQIETCFFFFFLSSLVSWSVCCVSVCVCMCFPRAFLPQRTAVKCLSGPDQRAGRTHLLSHKTWDRRSN